MANNPGKASKLLALSQGLIGYGVPVDGLKNKSLLEAVRDQGNLGMVESISLKEDGTPSDYLRDLAKRFALCSAQLEICYFYETKQSVDKRVSYSLYPVCPTY